VRVDACHLLNRGGVTRLCYAGSVLRTRPDGLNRTREPLQIGAEIYGHGGIESDVEVQRLMLRALRLAGVREISLDIGHVAVFRALLRRARVSRELESDLFQAMQAKDAPAIAVLARALDRITRDALAALPGLYGGPEVLSRARRVLPALPEIRAALRDLAALSRQFADLVPIRSFDLGELRGYHYHSGVVFAAYANARPNALAQGGRYDEVGKAFGRARPATGFSMDLRELVAAGSNVSRQSRVLAPYRPGDRALQQRIAALRGRGMVVIEDLPGHARHRADLGCDRELVRRKGRWIIQKVV
jgi:ATP phosphoribosyltransferase regulatory subunit